MNKVNSQYLPHKQLDKQIIADSFWTQIFRPLKLFQSYAILKLALTTIRFKSLSAKNG